MRKFWLGLCLSILVTPIQAEEFFVINFEQGEAWVSGVSYEFQPKIHEHLDYWQTLYAQEVMLMSGPFDDQSGGLFIVRVKDKQAAVKLLDGDPGIQSGVIQAGVKRWRIFSSAMRRAKPLVIEVEPDRTYKIERLDPDSPINLPRN